MQPTLKVAAIADRREPTGSLLLSLTERERAAAGHFGLDRRKRHFALGRLAARAALGRLLAPRHPPMFEILPGRNGEPLLSPTLQQGIAVSIAHSGSLAVACAWLGKEDSTRRIGIDIERLRPIDGTASRAMFSGRERVCLRRAFGEQATSLKGWTLKEACWKALTLEPATSPEALEITAIDLPLVWMRRGSRHASECFRVALQDVVGPDGSYLLTLAMSPHAFG